MYRGYAQAKADVERAKSLMDVPDNEMTVMVQEILWELVKEKKEAKRG